ncbi:MAG: hypothetical protein ACQET7_12640 [Thermodesulfobacteriota bacterium]
MMQENIILEKGEDPVRFTPDGKVAVVDAVKFMRDSDHWTDLWNKVVEENPGILQHCEKYSFENESKQLVVDSEGWERIILLLFETMSDSDFARIYDYDSG